MLQKIEKKVDYWSEFIGRLGFWGLFVCLWMGCSPGGKEAITICEFRVDTGYVSDDSKIYNKHGKLVDYLLQYEIKFSDGSRAEYLEKYAPNNSLAVFFDANGRKIATWAKASECFTQEMVYHYDERGRLANIRYIHIEANIKTVEDEHEEFVCDPNSRKLLKEWYGYEKASEYSDSLSYLAFRNRIEQIDYAVVDTAYSSQVNFEYNKQGDLVKVSLIHKESEWLGSEVDTCFKTEIVASEHVKLISNILPVYSFWSSDLDGGAFYVQVDQIEYDQDFRKKVEKRYVDFCLVYEKRYWNETLVDYITYDDYVIDLIMQH